MIEFEQETIVDHWATLPGTHDVLHAGTPWNIDLWLTNGRCPNMPSDAVATLSITKLPIVH